MNHPLVEEELMQIGLRRGGILGLHGFGDGSYNLGRREYMNLAALNLEGRGLVTVEGNKFLHFIVSKC